MLYLLFSQIVKIIFHFANFLNISFLTLFAIISRNLHHAILPTNYHLEYYDKNNTDHLFLCLSICFDKRFFFIIKRLNYNFIEKYLFILTPLSSHQTTIAAPPPPLSANVCNRKLSCLSSMYTAR